MICNHTTEELVEMLIEKYIFYGAAIETLEKAQKELSHLRNQKVWAEEFAQRAKDDIAYEEDLELCTQKYIEKQRLQDLVYDEVCSVCNKELNAKMLRYNIDSGKEGDERFIEVCEEHKVKTNKAIKPDSWYMNLIFLGIIFNLIT